MGRVQAQLTNNQDDRNNFHRKQQIALSPSQGINRITSPRGSKGKKSANTSAWLDLLLESPTIQGIWPNLDAATRMAVFGYFSYPWVEDQTGSFSVGAFQTSTKSTSWIPQFIGRLKNTLRKKLKRKNARVDINSPEVC